MTKTTITDKAIAAYLSAHPDFFEGKDKLLLKMKVPHGGKGSVSLVEKQVALMRENQQKTKKKMAEFIAFAESNKEIFDKSRKLVLDLIAAETSEDFFAALEKGLKRDFQCKAYSLVIFGKQASQINPSTFEITAASAKGHIGALMSAKKPVLGALRSDELTFLFRDQGKKVESVAVFSVRHRNKQLAMLAIGSSDAHYFSSNMDTLFIDFIADTLGRLLPRHLPRYL